MNVIQRLNLGHPAMQELYRRMVFNVLARNQDDHMRNIEFLMDKDGAWRLAPAYDMVWSHRSDSPWVGRHQMRVNGKTDNFTKDDLFAVANQYRIRKSGEILVQVCDAVKRWREFAVETKVDTNLISAIENTHRLNIVGGAK